MKNLEKAMKLMFFKSQQVRFELPTFNTVRPKNDVVLSSVLLQKTGDSYSFFNRRLFEIDREEKGVPARETSKFKGMLLENSIQCEGIVYISGQPAAKVCFREIRWSTGKRRSGFAANT